MMMWHLFFKQKPQGVHYICLFCDSAEPPNLLAKKNGGSIKVPKVKNQDFEISDDDVASFFSNKNPNEYIV